MTLSSPEFFLLLVSLLSALVALKKNRILRDSLAIVLVLVAVAGAFGIIA